MNMRNMTSTRIATAAVVVAGVGLGFGATFLPVPSFINDPHSPAHNLTPNAAAFRSALSFVAFSTALNLGAALLFLLGLKEFRTAFRRTYYWICTGLAVQTIGSVAYLVSIYLGGFNTDVTTIINEVPLATGIIMIYHGLLQYARLLRVESWAAKLRTVLLIYAIVWVIVAVLPHATHPDSNAFGFVLAHLVFFTEVIFYVFCAVLALAIRRTASRLYARSMLWFAIAVITAFVASATLIGNDYLAYPAWLTGDMISSLFIITNALSVVSAYVFNKISAYGSVKAGNQGNAMLDSIMFLASLVSRPREVDPVLDRVRGITAHHRAGEAFNAKEAQALTHIYRELVAYLSTKEPLRKLERSQIINLTQERFNFSA